MRRWSLLAAALSLAACQGRAEDFHDWAAVVVSGDDHAAHATVHTEAFDNARRDVARLLETRGFDPAHLAQFSVDGVKQGVPSSEPAAIFTRLETLAKQAPSGCLIYFSSHGAPGAVVVGKTYITPPLMERAIELTCGERPVAVILSACFSGSFVSALKGPDRFILTAARKDRASFGCGESDRYPYFDACVIEALHTAPDLVAVADRARACVAAREDDENLRPRSEPQLFVGPDFQLAAPRFTPTRTP